MNHERFHELLALRLYDELDTTETATLDEHLATCASCRAFANELDEGLGYAPRAQVSDDLPPGWIDELRTRIDPAPALARRTPWLAFASGLAAGLLVMAGWRALGDDVKPPTPPAEEIAAAFARDTPPPPASGRGPLAHLASLGRRR